MSAADQLSNLADHLTESFLKRLHAYCHRRVCSRCWYGSTAQQGPLVGGKGVEDIVQDAVFKTIAAIKHGPGKGRRAWNPDRDLFDHLTSVIDSEIDNLSKSWLNRNFEPFDSNATHLLATNDADLSPEQETLLREAEQRANILLSEFIDFLDDDEELTQIVGLNLDGIDRPRLLAHELQKPIEDIYNAQKRLKRKIKDFTELTRGRHE